MQIEIVNTWLYFCIAFGIAILTTFIMSWQSLSFYTKDKVVRKFSILDLELAGTAEDIVTIIRGIYMLPSDQYKSTRTIRSLRGQLFVDFLFMPAIYGSIFLLCMKVSLSLTTCSGRTFFIVLAWVQILAWICDIIENCYLFSKIHPDAKPSSSTIFKAYQFIEIIKWGTSLIGGICAISSLLFFWFKGEFSIHALNYVGIFIIEITAAIIIGFVLKRFAISN